MICYSIQPSDRIFVKGHGLLSFAGNMGQNIGKNISKNVNSKYSQKLLDHAKQTATDALKTASKRVIKKTAEATGNLIGNKIVDKNYKSLKNFTTEYFRNKWRRNTQKKIYVSRKKTGNY